jgi:hypothetical protein
MDERERARLRELYERLLKLHEQRGDEIAALRRANEALQQYHDAIGRLFRRP